MTAPETHPLTSKNMRTIVKSGTAPEMSIITNNFGHADYCDSYKVEAATFEKVDGITTKLFAGPSWADALMKVRNAVVGIFGLKTGDLTQRNELDHYPIGSRAGMFTVIDRNENEIVMAEDDAHLNFRTSVFIEGTGAGTMIHLTTLVKFNNAWGRLYFLPVKPFHQLIIRSLLRRTASVIGQVKQHTM